jgi:hypothetical protein
MTTATTDKPSTLSNVEQPLNNHRRLRYAFMGVALLIVAVPQMFVAGSTASTGHFILAGIGVVLIVAGTIAGMVKPRR